MEKLHYGLSHELLSCPDRNGLFQQPSLEQTAGDVTGTEL